MSLNNINSIKKENEKENEEKDKNNEQENKIDDKKNNEISEYLEKEKQLKIQQEKEKKELNEIIKILKIEKEKRIKTDILTIKDYLCPRITFFKNLLEQSEERLLKLIATLNYEVYKVNERIMNYGEEGNKCYALLKGKVGIYKPFPITKRMTLRDYVEYLVYVRESEKNVPKFERILNYNSKIDKIKLYSIDFDYTKIPQTNLNINIMVEEERELGKADPGIFFGEMALIKNEPRNASIIALEECTMISIDKIDYVKIVKDFEEQRLNKELTSFKQNYPIFRYWPPSKCFRLLSGFIKEEYDKDEHVYRQNDEPLGIYLIKEGIFEVYSNFNFNWYEKFIEYIHDTSFSLLNDLDNPMEWKEDRITKKLNDAYKHKSSPFIINKSSIEKVIVSNKEELEKNIDIVKEIEGEITNKKNQIYKANIQILESPNFFGFLEIFELKHRISSIKCISNKGTLMRFPLLEFLQLIPTDKKNQFYLQERIFKEKKNIITQLKNTILAKLNFLKKGDTFNSVLSKKFFNYNKQNIYINKLDFKKNFIESNLTPLKDLKLFQDKNSIRKLNKSRSSVYYNLSQIEKKEKILSFNDCINSNDYNKNNNEDNETNNNNNSFDNKKHNSKNGIILGFKKSVIKLTREKFEVIKWLFPKETIKKPSFPPSINIKQINNSDKQYIKYLENNVEQSKTPSKLRNMYINGGIGMNGKKYISLEASRFLYKLYGNRDKTKSTHETKNSDLVLPYINNAKSQFLENNENSKIKVTKLINYKVKDDLI